MVQSSCLTHGVEVAWRMNWTQSTPQRCWLSVVYVSKSMMLTCSVAGNECEVQSDIKSINTETLLSTRVTCCLDDDREDKYL